MGQGGSRGWSPLPGAWGIPVCAHSCGFRGGDVPSSVVVVRAVVPGVVEVGVSDVRLGQLVDVGLLDKLGRAGVAQCNRVSLPILQWLPCPGAPELR